MTYDWMDEWCIEKKRENVTHFSAHRIYSYGRLWRGGWEGDNKNKKSNYKILLGIKSLRTKFLKILDFTIKLDFNEHHE